MAEQSLEGKVAIVTGGATGIGRSIAESMARAGACVVIDYVGSSEKAGEAVETIRRDGGKALAFEADVTNPEQVNALVFQTVSRFGQLDVLVSNAGMEQKHPFLETPLDTWQKVIDVNLTGPWICSQAAARQMVAQGHGGRIIFITSVHEDLAMPTNAPYCAAKGGQRMLMRTLAVELAPYKITANDVAPGAIDTPMDKTVEQDPEEKEALLDEIPLRRMGKPEEVAGLCVYLASEAAAYITGSTFIIDGGMIRQSGSL